MEEELKKEKEKEGENKKKIILGFLLLHVICNPNYPNFITYLVL